MKKYTSISKLMFTITFLFIGYAIISLFRIHHKNSFYIFFYHKLRENLFVFNTLKSKR